ncbi:MAG: hypothetical protein KDK39_05635, partial [Leptospiraceae bacterium]|nr:hypothetical protein [Leptospiraceae bacterium]
RVTLGFVCLAYLVTLPGQGRLHAQSIPLQQRNPAENQFHYLHVARNPAERSNAPAVSRAMTNTRSNVSDAEWLAFHAYQGHPEKLQDLIQRKVDVNSGYYPSCGPKGNALFTAVMRDEQIIVKMLIGAGAKLDFTLHGGYTAISWGWVPRTPLQIAREMGNQPMIRILEHQEQVRGHVRQLSNPASYVGFVQWPTSKESVKAGIVYDVLQDRYAHRIACRSTDSSRTYDRYGTVEEDPASGQKVCVNRRYQSSKPYASHQDFEVLAHLRPLTSKQEVVWLIMYKDYSYDKAYKLPNGKLLHRETVGAGYSKSGIDVNSVIRFSERTVKEASSSGWQHSVLTIVEHD